MKPKCCGGVKDADEIKKNIRLLKMIAEENRLRMLCILKKGDLCVCQIIDNLGLSQSLISHHLKKLKDAGLIADKKTGLWVYYSLTKKGKKIADFNFK
jgi:ArsR family transcriptional regulator